MGAHPLCVGVRREKKRKKNEEKGKCNGVIFTRMGFVLSEQIIQGVLFGMKQAGINQGFWVMFLGLIPWFSTITH